MLSSSTRPLRPTTSWPWLIPKVLSPVGNKPESIRAVATKRAIRGTQSKPSNVLSPTCPPIILSIALLSRIITGLLELGCDKLCVISLNGPLVKPVIIWPRSCRSLEKTGIDGPSRPKYSSEWEVGEAASLSWTCPPRANWSDSGIWAAWVNVGTLPRKGFCFKSMVGDGAKGGRLMWKRGGVVKLLLLRPSWPTEMGVTATPNWVGEENVSDCSDGVRRGTSEAGW